MGEFRESIVNLRDWFREGAEKAKHPADRAWGEEVATRLTAALEGVDTIRLDAALSAPSTPAGPDGPVADSADGYKLSAADVEAEEADNRAEEDDTCPHCHGCGLEAGHHGLAGRCQWCKGTGRVEAEGSKT